MNRCSTTRNSTSTKSPIKFVAAAVAISEQMPKAYAALADQLRRAAWSVPLNIVRVLQGSAPQELANAKQLVVRMVEMLTKTCR